MEVVWIGPATPIRTSSANRADHLRSHSLRPSPPYSDEFRDLAGTGRFLRLLKERSLGIWISAILPNTTAAQTPEFAEQSLCCGPPFISTARLPTHLRYRRWRDHVSHAGQALAAPEACGRNSQPLCPTGASAQRQFDARGRCGSSHAELVPLRTRCDPRMSSAFREWRRCGTR